MAFVGAPEYGWVGEVLEPDDPDDGAGYELPAGGWQLGGVPVDGAGQVVGTVLPDGEVVVPAGGVEVVGVEVVGAGVVEPAGIWQFGGVPVDGAGQVVGMV